MFSCIKACFKKNIINILSYQSILVANISIKYTNTHGSVYNSVSTQIILFPHYVISPIHSVALFRLAYVRAYLIFLVSLHTLYIRTVHTLYIRAVHLCSVFRMIRMWIIGCCAEGRSFQVFKMFCKCINWIHECHREPVILYLRGKEMRIV